MNSFYIQFPTPTAADPPSSVNMSNITPYKIQVSNGRIDRLKRKLELTDLPSGIVTSKDSPWELGPPLDEIGRLADSWRMNFDWRKAEARLNQMPHFMARVAIDGFEPLDVHFLHKKSELPGAIPLLFLHGWPGNFLEASKLIDGLADGDGQGGPTFHVVAPSLIDFGFSSCSPVSLCNIMMYTVISQKVLIEVDSRVSSSRTTLRHTIS
jgi:hypothetical protein